MSIGEKIQSKLSEWDAAGPGRHELTVPVEGTAWVAHVTADRVDSLSSLVRELSLTRTEPAGADLKARAEAVSKVGGLSEPLKFIEMDEAKNVALLRSASPAKRATALAYFEAAVTPTSVSLCRFQKVEDQARREQIAFALTHESLAKLAEDLATA